MYSNFLLLLREIYEIEEWTRFIGLKPKLFRPQYLYYKLDSLLLQHLELIVSGMIMESGQAVVKRVEMD